MRTSRLTIAALALALPLSLAACGSSDADPGAASSAPMATSAAPSASDAMTADTASMPFGPGCAAVPADGAGSFSGMASDPVATAASNNPLLSTLVTAVKEAGLVDTLNSAPEVTVFAPTNDAFAKIPAADLKKVLADKPTLTKILTNHVVAGKISPDQLAGDHKTLAGTTITVKGSGESFTVGAMDAKIICGNVPTANATVYIVDSVLMP